MSRTTPSRPITSHQGPSPRSVPSAVCGLVSKHKSFPSNGNPWWRLEACTTVGEMNAPGAAMFSPQPLRLQSPQPPTHLSPYASSLALHSAWSESVIEPGTFEVAASRQPTTGACPAFPRENFPQSLILFRCAALLKNFTTLAVPGCYKE